MTAKAAPPPPPKVFLERVGDAVIATYATKRYRFLLNTGETIDVCGAVRDDSDLREAVLKLTGATRIEGVANVTPLPEIAAPSRDAELV